MNILLLLALDSMRNSVRALEPQHLLLAEESLKSLVHRAAEVTDLSNVWMVWHEVV